MTLNVKLSNENSVPTLNVHEYGLIIWQAERAAGSSSSTECEGTKEEILTLLWIKQEGVENIGVQVTKEDPKYWFWSKILGVYIVFCTNGKIIYLWSSGEVKSMNGLRNINGYVQRTYLLCYVFSTDHRASHKGTEKILGVEKQVKWLCFDMDISLFQQAGPFSFFFLVRGCTQSVCFLC
jgi:hypothetical protein